MTLYPFAYFSKQSLKENGAGGDGFWKILQGKEISSTGENNGDGCIFSAELKPPKSITGKSYM